MPTGCIYKSTIASPGTFTKIELVYSPGFGCSKGNIVYIPEHQWSQGIETHLIVIDCTSGTPVIGYLDMTDDPNFVRISQASQNYTTFSLASENYFLVPANYHRDGASHPGPGLEHPYFARRNLATSVGASVDPYLSNVVLLLGFDTVGNINSPYLYDESPKRRGTVELPATYVINDRIEIFCLFAVPVWSDGVAWPAHAVQLQQPALQIRLALSYSEWTKQGSLQHLTRSSIIGHEDCC